MVNHSDNVGRVLDYAENLIKKRGRSPSSDGDSDTKLARLKQTLQTCLEQIEQGQKKERARKRERRERERREREREHEREKRERERAQEKKIVDKLKRISKYHDAISPFYRDVYATRVISNKYAVEYFEKCGSCQMLFKNYAKFNKYCTSGPHIQADGKLLICDKTCEIICHSCVYKLANSKFSGNFGQTCKYYREHFN
jgi:Skp family chaperone for outer membrane proteins